MKRFTLAVDLGGTNVKIALIDNHRIIKKSSFPTRAHPGRSRLLSFLCQQLEEIGKSAGFSKSALLGVGLGVAGPVDFSQGLVYFFPNIPGWKDTPLKDLLSSNLGLPVWVDNDANLMALAEARLGAGRDAEDLICLTLGTGVGAGLILNGELYRGAYSVSGELGHMSIDFCGPRCACGSIGCLESYIGNQRLLREARRIFQDKTLSLEGVTIKARRGDKRAVAFWQKAGFYLGAALANVVNLINPQRIIIGGGVAQVGRFILDSVRSTIAKRAMNARVHKVKVVKALLGPDAGLLGAGVLVEEMVLAKQNLKIKNQISK